MDLSIVVPIYNESSNLETFYERLKSSLDKIKIETEIIFVNDGSSDDSLSIIKGFSEKDAQVKYIDLSRNFGHQIAIYAGLIKARGDAVVSIDGDLQDPPELISELYGKYKEGYEVVYAKRKSRKGVGLFKRIAYKLFYRILSKITSISIPLDTGDFRIIDKRIIGLLKEMKEQEKFLRGQIAWMGFNQTYIEYDRSERLSGSPGYTYRKLFRLAIDGITSFSNFPLRLATISGFLVSIVSFFFILRSIYIKLFTDTIIPGGWTSLMIAILFLGGIQLIGIGIMGEYISRISTNTRNRPLFIIKESNIG